MANINDEGKVNLPEFEDIEAAITGDTEAIQKMLKFFEAYILKHCIRWYYNEHGMPCSYIDEEKRKALEIKLITLIANFKLVRDKKK